MPKKNKITWGDSEWLLVMNNNILGRIVSNINCGVYYEVVTLDEKGNRHLYHLEALEIDFPEKTITVLEREIKEADV